MYYQHDGEQPHCSHFIRQYLNHKFPNRWIGCGGAQNWRPWSRDLNPLDYHVWGYMKAMVYTHKVSMREELFQWFSALQEGSTTLQCFVKSHVLRSHESENLPK